MKIKSTFSLCAVLTVMRVLFFPEETAVWAQTGTAGGMERPAVKVAFTDDQSIIVERILYTVLKRSGYQMVSKATGMRTAVADVNYGDAAILPTQTDGWDRMYPNLIKVPVAIDNVEFTIYVRSENERYYSAWGDLAGLKLGYRWQNEYVANNIRRAGAGSLVTLNDFDEIWASLLNGDADAVILPRMSHFEHRFPYGVRKAGVIEKQPVYTYVNRRYDYLVPLLENAYREIIEDGTMALIQAGKESINEKPVILHLNSFSAQNEWERGQMESIKKNLEANLRLEYYNSYLNSNESYSQADFNSIVSDMIRAEFITRHPDLIIASGNEALEFVLNNYFLLFSNVPVLFFGVYGFDKSMLYGLEEYFTGFFENVSFNETAAEMLRLFPETRRLFVLNGSYPSRSEKLRNEIKKSVESGQNVFSGLQVEIEFSEDKPLDKILKDISSFGSETLVLIGSYYSDSNRVFYSEADLQRQVCQASGNPVFSLSASCIGYGTLGGFVSSTGMKSRFIASMAADILKGRSPYNIPIINESAFLNQWQFDYETLKKFNIKTRNLLPGHYLINNRLKIWETNPDEFRLMMAIAVLLVLIIGGLMIFFFRNSGMTQRLASQRELLIAVNSVSSVLLEPYLSYFEHTLQNSMEIMAKAVNVDRICIWKKYIDDSKLRLFLNFQWEKSDFQSSDENGQLAPDLLLDEHLVWNETLTQGDCINSLVRNMEPAEQAALLPRNILSFFAVPVFLQDQFWGFVSYDSCKREHLFTDSEILILRSASRMVAHAIIRSEMTINLHDTAMQLEAAAKEASNANKAKSSFLANMSHEIRTPMNAILGIAEILLGSNDMPPDMEEAISKIYESGDLLLNIVNDILDLSKIEAGKLELFPVKYDIPSLVNDSAQLNRLRYDSKPVNFSVHVDENTPHYLFGDELRIKQVLNNILSNAFKYTEEGSVSLFISAGDGHDSENVTLILRVLDTGQGMTEKQIASLFDEYTRFNAKANRETVGTGLGMSITKHLLNLMNGEISVQSTPGMGSEFTVRIPQKRAGSEVCGSEVSEKLRDFNFRSTTLTNKAQFIREYMPYGSVLVVDDVESNIYVVKGMLAPYGIKADSAFSGFEAVQKIEEGNLYDIVFMDHMMPKMDGIETTKLLRSMGYTRTVVALTANALIGREKMFLENGFDGFIAKPIDSRELNVMLNELIRNKQPPEVIEAARQEAARKNDGNNPRKVSIKTRVPGSAENDELTAAAADDIRNALAALEDVLPKLSSGSSMKLYTTTVHGLKSALANIGEDSLSYIALRLEKAGDNGETELILSETPGFMDVLRKLTGKIKPAKKNDSVKVSLDDIIFLRDKLNEIKTACEKFIIKDAKIALAGLKERTWPSAINEIISEISIFIVRGELNKAETAVIKFLDTAAKENI